MRVALARHDAVVAGGVRHQHGFVLKARGEGDSQFAVFRHAREALAAAFVIQRVLTAQRWPTTTPLRVRMAIHTGKVELRERDYYGPTVNRCARLRALGHGGQVLLSGVSAQLVLGQLPPGASLKDLGSHRLKDLDEPEHVWQLMHPQLPASFSLLKSADVLPVLAPDEVEPQPEPELAVADQRAMLYKVTDQFNRTPDGREWGPGVSHSSSGSGDPRGDTWIRCYRTPKLAALLNASNERVRQPHLWEAAADAQPDEDEDEPMVAATLVTTLRQVPMPRLTAQDHARFAVLCAQAAFRSGLLAIEFATWAQAWLAGQDRSADTARGLGQRLESDAYRAGGLLYPDMLAAAHAAQSAVHAARTAWLGGRSRDDASERAAELAAEAVHLASRVARLDLVALAERAVPDAAVPELSTRVA